MDFPFSNLFLWFSFFKRRVLEIPSSFSNLYTDSLLVFCLFTIEIIGITLCVLEKESSGG